VIRKSYQHVEQSIAKKTEQLPSRPMVDDEVVSATVAVAIEVVVE
jgi:hypothetical protein